MFELLLKEIIIPKAFQDSGCALYKIEKAKQQIIKDNGIVTKPIVISMNKILLDGYSRYLAAKSLGLEKIFCEQHEQFIHGTFEGNPKRYVWVNSDHIPIKRGDFVVVENKDKTSIVKVQKVFTSQVYDCYPMRKKILRKVGFNEQKEN